MMDFSQALLNLKDGKQVCRKGWNGKGMWISLVPRKHWAIDALIVPHDDVMSLLPFIGMKTADDKFVPWLASQTDILAEDWMLVR